VDRNKMAHIRPCLLETITIVIICDAVGRWLIMTTGDIVDLRGRVTKIFLDRNGTERVVLGDVYINDQYHRDHSFIQLTKRLQGIQVGDTLTARATINLYIDPNTNKATKIGFRSLRDPLFSQ